MQAKAGDEKRLRGRNAGKGRYRATRHDRRMRGVRDENVQDFGEEISSA